MLLGAHKKGMAISDIFSERPDANSRILRSNFQRGKIKQKGGGGGKELFKGKNSFEGKPMLKSPSSRPRGENQVGLKKPPGAGPPSPRPVVPPSRRDAAGHTFAPVAVLPLARSPPLPESVAALPVVLISANGAAGPSRARAAVSKSGPPEKQVARRDLLIRARLAGSLAIRSTAVAVFRNFEVINAVGCFQCLSQTASLGDLFR